MNVEIKNSLATILENYPISDSSPPNKIKKTLQGLQLQVERLTNAGDEIFSKLKDYGNWNDQKYKINEIRSMLNTLKNSIFLPEKTNFFSHLEGIKVANQQKLIQLIETLDNEVFFKHNDDLDILKLLKEEDEKSSYNEKEHLIIEYGLAKFEKLRKKIEIQNVPLNFDFIPGILSNFTSRISKVVFSKLISEEIDQTSAFKDSQRILTKERLKNAWLDALESQIRLKEYIQRNLLAYETLPKIKECQKNIQIKNEYFYALMQSLKKISISQLALGFDPEYDSKKNKDSIITAREMDEEYLINETLLPMPARYKRNFSKFFEDAENYMKLKEEFENENIELIDLRKLVNNLSQKMLEVSISINKKIEEIEKEDAYISTFHSTDSDIKKFLYRLKNDELKNLKQLRDEIEDNWNQCLWNISKVEQQRDLFKQFSDVNENLSLCYFLAEEIHGDLRQARKANDNQQDHCNLPDYIRHEFKILSNLIGQTCEKDQTSENVTQNLISNSISFNKLLEIFKNDRQKNLDNIPKLSFILTTDCKDIFELKVPDSCKVYDNFRDKFYWNSKGIDTTCEMTKEIQKKFENEFIEYQNDVTSGFKNKLKEICEYIITGFESEVKALYHYAKDPNYRDCFTRAFFAKNRIGKVAQTLGTYVKYGTGKFIETLVLPSYQQNITQQTDNINGENEHNEGEDLQEIFNPDLNPLTSPFATMKLTF